MEIPFQTAAFYKLFDLITLWSSLPDKFASIVFAMQMLESGMFVSNWIFFFNENFARSLNYDIVKNFFLTKIKKIIGKICSENNRWDI